MSQLFWPESGLQVPHLGPVGWARASVAAVRRMVRAESCILSLLWSVEVFGMILMVLDG